MRTTDPGELSHLLGKAIQAHPKTHRAPNLGEVCCLGVLFFSELKGRAGKGAHLHP